MIQIILGILIEDRLMVEGSRALIAGEQLLLRIITWAHRISFSSFQMLVLINFLWGRVFWSFLRLLSYFSMGLTNFW